MEKQLQKGCVVFMKMRKADIIEFYRRTFETLLPKPLPAQSEEVEKHIVELLETYSKEWVAESGTFKPAPLKRSTFKVAAQAIAALIVPSRTIISEAMDNLALAKGDVDVSEHIDALCEKLGGDDSKERLRKARVNIIQGIHNLPTSSEYYISPQLQFQLTQLIEAALQIASGYEPPKPNK